MLQDIKKLIEQNWLKQYNEQGTALESIKLEGYDSGQVVSHFVNLSTFFNYTQGNTQISSDKFTASFIKAQSVELKEKTEVGLGEVDLFNAGEIITFKWDVPLTTSMALFQSSITPQLLTLASDKLSRAMDKYSKIFEANGYAKMAKDANEVTLDDGLSAEKIRDILIANATKLTQMRDKKEGIDLIARDDILITVTPELADKLATLGILGNGVIKYLEDGSQALNYLGGYKIQVSPFLPDKVNAIIAPTWSAAASRKLIAANIAKLNPTEDMAIYYEEKSITGVIYKKAVVKLVSQ